MELPVIRACAEGIQDPVIGLNHAIDTLILDSTNDIRPSHPAYYNYVDDPWVSNKLLQMEEVRNGVVIVPAVIIYMENPPIFEAEVGTNTPGTRDATMEVVFSYISAEPASIKEVRDALYINWAMMRFLAGFNANTSLGVSLRTRGSVSLYRCLDIKQYAPFSPFGEVAATAGTVVTFKVREHSP